MALKLLNSSHGIVLRRAKTSVSERLKLAGTLLEQADRYRKNPSRLFIWLQKAAELAAASGDATVALQAVTQIGRAFAVDESKLRVDALQKTSAALKKTEEFKALVEVILGEITEAIERDNYELAGKLGEVARTASMGTKYLPTVLSIRREQAGIAQARKKFATIKPHFQKLDKQPTDEEANLQVGKYLCLLKGDWRRGLYFLAQGNDRVLRLQAQRDLIRPASAEQQLQVGDAWWNLAAKQQGLVRIHLKQRAVHWYEQALYEVDKKRRQQLEERIKSVPPPRFRRIAWDYSGAPGQIRVVERGFSSVYGVAYSPTGRRVASGDSNNKLNIFDARTGKKLLTCRHTGLVWNVVFGRRGRYVFSSSWDNSVRMWDAKTGKQIRQFSAGPGVFAGNYHGLALSKNGRQLMSGSGNGKIYLWEVKTGKVLKLLTGHRGQVNGVAFSPDGKRALSGGSWDRQLIYWDLKTGKSIRTITPRAGGQIWSVAFTPDGRKAVAAGETVVRLWNLKTGKEIRTFTGHTSTIYAVAIAPDGTRLATAGADRTIRYWNLSTGKLIRTFTGHTSTVASLAFSPGGGKLVSGSWDNTVRIWGLPRR